MAGCTIGVDLGGTKMLAGAVAADGTVLARERREVGGLGLEDLLDTVAAGVAAVADGREVTAVGFGIPSLIDRATGISVRCVHLPLDGVAFGDRIAERVPQPIAVDNDANCALLAEARFGAAAGARNVVVLTLGTGVGGGLLIDGRIYRGTHGAAAELGHVPVDLDGPECFGGCPGRGCLEALVSGSAITRDAGAPAEVVVERARAGDAAALELLTAVGTHLGAGLAGLAMTFDPDVIVVGGGVIGAGDLLLDPARTELCRRAMDPSRQVPVAAAALGPEAGMVGAALLAAETA